MIRASLLHRSSEMTLYLLVFVPAALALDWYDFNPILVFLAAAAAVVPLSDLIGQSTEDLGTKLGETLGGMLNATMGNLPELIMGPFALRKGLQTVVKASLTGSILGNIVLHPGPLDYRRRHAAADIALQRLSGGHQF